MGNFGKRRSQEHPGCRAAAALQARLERELDVPEEIQRGVDLRKLRIDADLAVTELRLTERRIAVQRQSMEVRIGSSESRVTELEREVESLLRSITRLEVVAERHAMAEQILRRRATQGVELRLGDIAEIDDDGFLLIVDRKKDMILAAGGFNVYPREIEEYLFTHPDIVDAQVVGVPDERFGEQIMAWIQKREGSGLTEGAVVDYCKGQIAHFKVPYYVKFVDDFPMTVTGKVQKK